MRLTVSVLLAMSFASSIDDGVLFTINDETDIFVESRLSGEFLWARSSRWVDPEVGPRRGVDCDGCGAPKAITDLKSVSLP